MNNNARRLPDAYDKKDNSNTHKLLSLACTVASMQEKDLNDINASRELEKATGKTLYYYGKMFNVPRGGATDKQYVTKILTQIVKNTATPDTNGVINAIEKALQSEGVSIEEHDMSISVHGLKADILGKSGYSSIEEVEDLIRTILPIGISLETVTYEGSLLIFDITVSGPSDYPLLYSAWLYGQEAAANGSQVGLAGHGEVPSSFAEYAPQYSTTGDYEGGSLSFFGN